MNSPVNLNVEHLLQQGVVVLEFIDEKPYASLRMLVRIMVDDEAVGYHPLVKLLFELTVSRVDTKGGGIQVDEAHPERRAQDGYRTFECRPPEAPIVKRRGSKQTQN